ncbi:MAG: winged helix-turn-helix transcriptional regulator [Gammaproteobacteria bacterium]|nr:winged helix-turn-helix domain-containing protein [Gammaproteobacteria bacterium]MDE2109477.1 winged helix-turn-helix transcriptional regulator [Gammaproteobacteria bacterium]MDE2460452.1 winged helix-turn-helix transcriptional regulator [Gammaproteobacteria bacterium]
MKTNAQTKLQVLGDPTRMAIFERLADGPLAVVDIAEGLPVTRSAVSQHLKVLKEAGLITNERAANRNLYQLNPKGVAGLRDYFDQFWRESLQSFKQAAEKSYKEKSR